MKCLYCGKDIPLLKRLAKGEFCSDEHRLSYQQEYSQLALNRLLQTYSPEDSPKAAKAGKAQVTAEKLPPAPAQKSAAKTVESTPPNPAPVVAQAPSLSRSPVTAKSGGTATLTAPVEPKAIIPPAPPAESSPVPKPTLSKPLALDPAPHASPQVAPHPSPQSLPQSAPHPAPMPDHRASSEKPKLSLPAKRARSMNLVTPETSSPAPVELRAKDGRPEPKRWSSPKTGVAALALAVSEGSSQEHAQPAKPVVSLPTEPASLGAPSPQLEVNRVEGNKVQDNKIQDNPVQDNYATAAAVVAPHPPSIQPVVPDVPAPAPLAGDVSVLPPAVTEMFRVRSSLAMAPTSTSPALPLGGLKPVPPSLMLANCLSSNTFVDALKAPWNSRPVRLEFREFARRELVFEFRSTIQGTRVELATQPATLPFTPLAVRATATLWFAPAVPFPPIEDHKFASKALELPLPESIHSKQAPSAGSEETQVARSESSGNEAQRDPNPVATPQLVVFDAIPGGRGKAVQVFASTLRAPVVVDVPRHEGLPMRALMVVERNNGLQGHSNGMNHAAEVKIAELFRSRSSSPVATLERADAATGQRTLEKPFRTGEG